MHLLHLQSVFVLRHQVLPAGKCRLNRIWILIIRHMFNMFNIARSLVVYAHENLKVSSYASFEKEATTIYLNYPPSQENTI
jgi:hypothetical protein